MKIDYAKDTTDMECKLEKNNKIHTLKFFAWDLNKTTLGLKQ